MKADSVGDGGADLSRLISAGMNESADAFSLVDGEVGSWLSMLLRWALWWEDEDAFEFGVEGGEIESAEEIENDGVDGVVDAEHEGDEELLLLGSVMLVASRNVSSIGERGPDVDWTSSWTRSDHLFRLCETPAPA